MKQERDQEAWYYVGSFAGFKGFGNEPTHDETVCHVRYAQSPDDDLHGAGLKQIYGAFDDVEADGHDAEECHDVHLGESALVPFDTSVSGVIFDKFLDKGRQDEVMEEGVQKWIGLSKARKCPCNIKYQCQKTHSQAAKKSCPKEAVCGTSVHRIFLPDASQVEEDQYRGYQTYN